MTTVAQSHGWRGAMRFMLPATQPNPPALAPGRGCLHTLDDDTTDPREGKRRHARLFGIQHRRHSMCRATHLHRFLRDAASPTVFRYCRAALSAQRKSGTRNLGDCLTVAGQILRPMLNQPNALDRLFHALADPARRAMVERLSQGPAPVTELARPLPMSLPSAMQHLGVLEAAGLVRSEKLGRVRTCSIEANVLSLAEQWINARRVEWGHRLDHLGEYLKTQESEGKGHGSGE
jgi:DNA-binding transcriptional ArsR family regulator